MDKSLVTNRKSRRVEGRRRCGVDVKCERSRKQVVDNRKDDEQQKK